VLRADAHWILYLQNRFLDGGLYLIMMRNNNPELCYFISGIMYAYTFLFFHFFTRIMPAKVRPQDVLLFDFVTLLVNVEQ